MQKVNIGLDLGIASVGWAIADENLNLLHRGIRLFDALDDNGKLANAKRREKRAARRQTSRRKNLKKDFIKLLVQHQLVDKNYLDAKGRVAISLAEFGQKYSVNSKDENILNVRLEATRVSIELNKLIGVLYWYLSNRGFEYEVDDEDYSKAQKDFGAILSDSKDKMIVEIQSDFFKQNGFLKSSLNRNFSTKQYLKEIDLILNKASLLTNDFKESFKKLFQRRRNFEQGPGPDPKNIEVVKKMANIPMHKGLFERSRYTIVNGEVNVGSSVWEKTIGKCSRYPELDRAPKASFSAEIFNLLNDLNNITIHPHKASGEAKLSKEQKVAIINLSLKTKSNINSVLKYIEYAFDVERDEIYGLRQKVGKNSKIEYLLTELASYHAITKSLGASNIDFEKLTFNGNFSIFKNIDDFIEPCYKFSEIEKRVEHLSKLDFFNEIPSEKILVFSRTIKVASATHALSIRALNEYAMKLLNSEDNYSKLSYDDRQDRDKVLSNRKYIQSEWVEELIASPTIKRGIRQAIKVLNAIIKTYPEYQVENIVIEMARETNDKQARDNIKELQASLATINAQIKEYVDGTKSDGTWKPSKNIVMKLWLYQQQKGRDPYDGKFLPDPSAIVRNPNLVDIDHIIPYSQSFDDSRNNKVLTTKEHNSKKGNLSAHQYINRNFGMEKYNELFELWMEMFIKNNQVFNAPNKFKNLVDSIDYSNPSNTFGFINRNLVDTRYIAREVLNGLQAFVQNTHENHPWHQAGIKTINGKMTSFISKVVSTNGPLIRPNGFNDNRFDEKWVKVREWNGHHSEDAFLIIHGALKNRKLNKFIEKTINNPFMSQRDKEEFAKDMQSKFDEDLDFEKRMDVDKIREQLNDHKNFPVQFSYMLTTRNNREFSNETFYSAVRDDNGELHKVVKIKLKDADAKKLGEIFNDEFNENKKYKIPMKDFDHKSFNALKQIFEGNLDQKEPFAKHCDEKGRVSIVVGNKNVERKISQITIVQEIKNETEIIKVNGNADSFFESMEWIELRIYKNIQDKYKIVPVTAANHFIKNDVLIPKTNILEKVFEEKQIIKDAKPWIILKKGSILKDLENNLYRVNGQSHSQDKIELKRLDGLNAKKQEFFTVNSKLKDWEICEINALGKTKKIAKF